MGNGELVLNGHNVRDDGKVLEIDGGDSFTTLWIYIVNATEFCTSKRLKWPTLCHVYHNKTTKNKTSFLGVKIKSPL